VILPGTTIDCARLVAERARHDISKTVFRYDGKESSLTVSVGVAQLTPNEHVTRMLERVDHAMYASKKAGRNKTYWHDGRVIHPVLEESAMNLSAEESAGAIPRIVITAEAGDLTSSSSSLTPASPRTVVQPSHASPDSMGSQCDRTAFLWHVRQRIAEWKRGGNTFSVLLVQVEPDDHIVDTQAQEARDNVLRVTAQILNGAVREMDLIGRYDRTCFSVLLPRTALKGGMVVAQRVRQSIDFSVPPFNRSLEQFTVSVGVAEVAEGDDVVRLLQRAETAMSAAEKSHGCYHNEQWPGVVATVGQLRAFELSAAPGAVEVGAAVSTT
jgi:diguanylate cyclase (GGDEF)-like protein